MSQLRGVVMCGGQSKRMGTDKGLIPLKGLNWATHMANKLTSIHLPASVSINSTQLESYQEFFSPDDLVLDRLAIPGPLNGLLSAHLKYPDDDLLILGCDMIGMLTNTLSRLVDCYKVETAYDFYVYQNQNYAEPFCGIYTATGLGKALFEFNTIKPTNLSMQKILNEGYTRRLPITETDSFENNNTPFTNN